MHFLYRHITANCSWWYHFTMMNYHAFKKRRIINAIKKAGKEAELPSLDGYSDDAIARAFRDFRNRGE